MKKNELSNDKLYILLFDYLMRNHQREGTLPESPVVIKSIWANNIIEDIAAEYQIKCITIRPDEESKENTLYEELKIQSENIVFDFYQRSKRNQQLSENDSQLIEKMKQEYTVKKRSLCGALRDLYRKFGYFNEEVVSIYYGRIDSVSRFLGVVTGFSPHTLGGYEVLKKLSYMEAEESGDIVMEFQLSNGARVIVHPAGKEKNIYIYITAHGESEDLVEHTILNLKRYIVNQKYSPDFYPNF